MDVMMQDMLLEKRIKEVIAKRYTRPNTTSRECRFYVPEAGKYEFRMFNERMTGELIEALGTYEELISKMHPQEIINIAKRDK